MKVYNGLSDFCRGPDGCVAVIGNFDGVHLGHQAIIAQGRELAKSTLLPLVVMTFSPSAVRVLRPDSAPRILTALEIKRLLLAEQGVDELVIVAPTREFLSLSPEDFVREVLVESLGARHVVEGQTFGFGSRRSGTVVSLAELGKRMGFETHMVASHKVAAEGAEQVAVSSTLVRQLVRTCRFGAARKCLGRAYALAGHVVAGRGRGKELGFPTANLALYDNEQLTPPDGVFAGWVRLGGSAEEAWQEKYRHAAAISIGRSETFADSESELEAHLLNYQQKDESLYGRHMVMSFVEAVRPRRRFANSAELSEAIGADCQKVEGILGRDRGGR